MSHRLVPQTVRTVIQAQGSDGQELINVPHFRTPGTPSYADCLAINAFVNTWVNTNYKNLFPPVIAMRQIVSTSIAEVDGPQATLANTTAGSRSGNQIPMHITLCVKLSTHQAGRRHRGRFYPFAPVFSDLLTPGRFTSGYVTGAVGIINNLIAAAQGAGYPLVVCSLVGLTSFLVSEAVAVDDIVDHMDTRLPERGR